MNLLAQSLRDFSSDAWWAICDALVDGKGHAYDETLELSVGEHTRPGDLRRAAASYADELPKKFGSPSGEPDEVKGAYLLTVKIIATLNEQGVVEHRDAPGGPAWYVTDAYLAIHRLETGGVRFAYNVDGNWTTYDAQPAAMREARRQADNDRLNTTAAISAAANYRRPVQTGEERSPKYTTARRAAFELYESLLRHGYLDAFPVTINQHGRVVAGNHRLRFAELARVELLTELEHERQNGSDPITVADLERRIASLVRDRIMQNAIIVTNDADEVRVTTASEVQIPWAEHERKQLAKRLAVDGLNAREIADRLGQSERTIRRWTTEERTDVKAVQEVEAARLHEDGWTRRRIAEHLGVPKGTVDRWLAHSGQQAKMGHPVSPPKTPVASATNDPVRRTALEDYERPEDWPSDPKPDRDMSPLAAAERQRRVLKRDRWGHWPRWTDEDVADAEVIRQYAGLD